MVINTSRTLAVSERDPSLDPPVGLNSTVKNLQLQTAYNQQLGTSGQKFQQQIRKSRAGRESFKNPNASVEPPLSITQNASVN